mgnify:CR=1 FL=1
MSDNVYKSRDIWRAAFKSALPVMCGYVPLAMAFLAAQATAAS